MYQMLHALIDRQKTSLTEQRDELERQPERLLGKNVRDTTGLLHFSYVSI